MAATVKKIPVNYTRPFVYDFQRPIIDSPARYTVTLAATKIGKTATHIIWLFEQALKINNGHSVWWVAPTHSQAKIAYNRMKLWVNDQRFFSCNETNLIITLRTGAKIEFKTAEKPDNLFGDDVYAFVFDEFTRAREGAWFALRTTITSTGGPGKFIGNAKGRKNWGYKLWVKANTSDNLKNGGEFECFKITAYDAAAAGMKTKDGRPFIEEIESAKRDLPESVFNELYLAEASEDGSNPFGLSHIAGCIAPMSNQPAICFGVDVAKSVDFTAKTGLDKDARVCYFDIYQRSWDDTIDDIVAMPGVPIAMDSTGNGDPVHEFVCKSRSDVEGYVFTQVSRQILLKSLAVAIQKRLLTFPDNIIRAQLENFEYVYTETGVKYAVPEDEHDDAAISLALAWYKWQTASVSSDGPSVW